jgi:hypothetical protein
MTMNSPRLGRPPLASTNRVREIMSEEHVSYGTAYARARKEREARGAEYLSLYPFLSVNEAYVLKHADSIREKIEQHLRGLSPVEKARHDVRAAEAAGYETQEEMDDTIRKAHEALAAAREKEGTNVPS